ncbi:N-acetylmuramoyl-L-alanine amidase LytC [bioreactor metagenome]|uniref:N-acetylmuramoyl-L-alanine amidase LytC n=1 Tax=bioreactor metagenome TaxID=1076179 RepID=A0A645DCW7_9ZZZZ
MLYFQKAPQASTVAGKPLTGVRVLLDAGHGGTDKGAAGIGAGSGTTEKTVNLALTLAVQERLEQLGATVLMSRTDDTFPTLQDRWAMQQKDRPDFFIALHHNSTGLTKDTSEAKGLEVYYFDRISASFAQNLMDTVAAATARATDTPKWNYFYVTRITSAPSVLFEFGYLVNPQEYEDCTSEAGIRAAAEGVAEGILRSLPATP